MSKSENSTGGGASPLQLFRERLKEAATRFWGALRSPGLGRWLALGSMIFLAAAAGLTAWAFKRLADQGRLFSKGASSGECRELKCSLNALEAHIQKQQALAEVRDATVSLGDLQVALVGTGSGRKGESGVVLELEIAVQFDSAETGRWVAANLAPVRSEVFNSIAMLTHLTRADVLEPEGKLLIRDRVRDRMNSLLPSGTVKQVYFNKFVVK